MSRKISQRGIDLIKSFEGFKPEAYQDQGGKWTVGYGSTLGITPLTKVTPAEAELFLRRDLDNTEICINTHITYPLTQNEYDAICSFVYNVGATAFLLSQMRSKIQYGMLQDAADEFLKWKFIHGAVNQGLLNRRTKERELFLEPCMPTP